MTKEKTLENFCKSFLHDSIDLCIKFNLKKPLKQKQDTQFEFKHNSFNKKIEIIKNDYSEFFSRQDFRTSLEKITDFTDVVDMISTYPNIKKRYSERGIDVKNMVYLFIENYIISVNDFKFVDSKFYETFKSFSKFLDSDILEVVYFTPLFRLSFPSKYKYKDFGKIKLRKINEEQFKIIKESLVGKIVHPPGYIRKLEYVIETTIQFNNNVEQEDKLANNTFKKFLNTAHLFRIGDLQMGALYKNFTPWTIHSSKISKIYDVELGPRIFKLNSNTSKNLKNFHQAYLNLNLDAQDWSFIQVAIDRFSSSILRHNSIDKIVDLNVALECLFSSAGETSLKISNRTAMIFGSNEDEQERCWNFIKDEYKLRNDILHGRKEKDFDIADDVAKLENIIRFSIRKFLNLSKNISKKELKNQGKLPDGKTIRDYLLEQLDLGLINRLNLEKFSKKTIGIFD